MFLVGFFGLCLIEIILRKLFMADDEKRSMCLAVINYVTCEATTNALYSTIALFRQFLCIRQRGILEVQWIP